MLWQVVLKFWSSIHRDNGSLNNHAGKNKGPWSTTSRAIVLLQNCLVFPQTLSLNYLWSQSVDVVFKYMEEDFGHLSETFNFPLESMRIYVMLFNDSPQTTGQPN